VFLFFCLNPINSGLVWTNWWLLSWINIKSLPCDWTLARIFRTSHMESLSMWENTNVFVLEFTLAHFTEHVFSNNHVGCLELILFLFGVKLLHLGQVHSYLRVFLLGHHVVENGAKETDQVVLGGLQFPILRNESQNSKRVEVISGWMFFHELESLFSVLVCLDTCLDWLLIHFLLLVHLTVLSMHLVAIKVDSQ